MGKQLSRLKLKKKFFSRPTVFFFSSRLTCMKNKETSLVENKEDGFPIHGPIVFHLKYNFREALNRPLVMT